MSTPNTATFLVGWIAALRHELAAARCMLDEEFDEAPDDFSPPSSDSNTYTWGRVGKHNVVITSLPEGIYGPSAATEVASRLSASVPHIRFGLMVGIGAGIANDDNEIRLGDVVVSKPTSNTGGVVQYDSRKAKAELGERHYERIGFLSKPPTVLLTALARWGSTFEMDGSQISTILSKTFETRPRMKKTFGYPGAAKDPLRRDIPDNADDERLHSPEIHFGVVASGHTLLKSTEERDRILTWLREEGIKPLCFEMEAAGLMDAFPCLAVRGICDYADEKKNDDWQRYAALTAASFAKELLLHVEPAQVTAEETLQRRLGNIENDVQLIRHDTAFSFRHARREELGKLLQWISPEDYSDRLHDVLKRHQRGTVRWFLDSPEYKSWSQCDGEDGSCSKVLFCYGHQGAGKTMISALVVQELLSRPSNRSRFIMYVFFDHKQRDTQTAEHVLATILRQSLHARQTGPNSKAFEILRNHVRDNTRPSLDQLEEALKNTLAGLNRTHIVLDALDECQKAVLRPVLESLQHVIRDCNAHLLVTSRRIPEVEVLFRDEEKFEIKASAYDLALYIRKRASAEFQEYITHEDALMQRVVDVVVDISAGSFLLARLSMDHLAGQDTIADLEDSLETIPYGEDGLKDMHEKALERIQSHPPRHANRALEALVWVVYGERLVSCSELEHALAFDIDDTTFNRKKILPIHALVSQCAGLLTIDDESKTVRIIHRSTQLYLEETLRILLPYTPDALLACKCITYITIDSLGIETIVESIDHKRAQDRLVSQYPLYDYVVVSCVHHALHAERESRTEEFDRLFHVWKRLEGAKFALACIMSQRSWSFWWCIDECRGTTTWHVMAVGDLVKLYEAQSKVARQSNAVDYQGRSPMHWAASHCSVDVASFLLDQDLASATTSDKNGATPLFYAARNGSVEMVQLLLSHGDTALQMREDLHHDTPLHIAAARGYEEVVQTLLNMMPSTIAVKCLEQEPSPLTLAAKKLHERVVGTILSLVKFSVNTNHAVHGAISGFHDGVLGVLLKSGKVDLSCLNASGRTPLYVAAQRGRESTVKLLLDYKYINVNCRNTDGSTPLHGALYRAWYRGGGYDSHDRMYGSYDRIIKILLTSGKVDVSIRDVNGETPLSLAALYGKTNWHGLLLKASRASPVHHRHAVDYAWSFNIIRRKLWSLTDVLHVPAAESSVLKTIESHLASSGWQRRLQEMKHDEALVLYLFMTDEVCCRSCGLTQLHQGYHCKTCLDDVDVLMDYWRFIKENGLPTAGRSDFFADLRNATNLCPDCVKYGCLDESIALYLRSIDPRYPRSPIIGIDCGSNQDHELLWIDAQPLLETRFDSFIPPFKAQPIDVNQRTDAALQWKAQIQKTDDLARQKMDAGPMDFETNRHSLWRFRQCSYLHCDTTNDEHHAWCVKEVRESTIWLCDSGDCNENDAHVSWCLRWYRRYDSYNSSTQSVVESHDNGDGEKEEEYESTDEAKEIEEDVEKHDEQDEPDGQDEDRV